MKKRRLLTLYDLYTYYSSTDEASHFCSEDQNENLVVQVSGKINFSNADTNAEGLMPVTLQACHIDLNVNNSNISEDVMTAALPSFSNRPILGYIHEVNGQWEFYGHNMHVDENDEIVYDEIPIGIIPESCNARLEYDEEKGKTYCVVDGYIFEEYTKAAEILQREGECSVSVELSIRELSYNAKDKYLNIEDFFFSGVTILGKNEDGKVIKPGMEGSNITLADFSMQNNSMFYEAENTKLIEVLDRLNTTLSNFNTITAERKEEPDQMTKFEELLEKYGKSVEDITFEYEGLSDEDLEAKFAEVFEETSEPTPKTPEKFQKIFELSHSDIRCALYNLLAPFEEADNDWYWIDSVYDFYFTYANWDGTKIYGQNYTKDDTNVAFEGERFNLHKELLTDAEYAELQSMRSNYASIQAELAKYQKAEEDAKKDNLFTSTDYKNIYENDEFISLKENHSELSFEELNSKLDEILLSYAKSGNLNFSIPENKEIPNKHVGKVSLPMNTQVKKKNRYGSLFSK